MMLRVVASAALAVFLSWSVTDVAHSAPERVALVMGNGAYKAAGQLPNAARDAEAMAETLRAIGFDVLLGTDLDRDGMMLRLNEFGSRANNAEVALFFYAGHGIQLDGKNLLIPVDADLRSEFDAKMRTVEIDTALQATIADAKVKLILLDACRDNPFAKQIQAGAPKSRSIVVGTGLAEMRPGSGTLIAFATGPGQVALDGEGLHSPFTQALLDNLSKPNLEVRHMLTYVRQQVVSETQQRQLPWENTNLTGFFYLNPKSDPAAQALAAPAAAPSASSAGTQVAALTPAGAALAAAPAPVADTALEREFWSSVKESTDPTELRAYLSKYPDGNFADLARLRIASLTKAQEAAPAAPSSGAAGAAAPVAAVPAEAAPAGPDIRTAEASAATEDALGLDLAAWKEIQTRLNRFGFDAGKADGKVASRTRVALKQWQGERSYPVSGYLNKPQYDAMLREAVPETPPAGVATRPSGAQSTRSVSNTNTNATGRRNDGSNVSGSNTTAKKKTTNSSAGDAAGAAFMGGLIGGAIGGLIR